MSNNTDYLTQEEYDSLDEDAKNSYVMVELDEVSDDRIQAALDWAGDRQDQDERDMDLKRGRFQSRKGPRRKSTQAQMKNIVRMWKKRNPKAVDRPALDANEEYEYDLDESVASDTLKPASRSVKDVVTLAMTRNAKDFTDAINNILNMKAEDAMAGKVPEIANALFNKGYAPKSGDEQEFVKAHTVSVTDYPVGNEDGVPFVAKNVEHYPHGAVKEEQDDSFARLSASTSRGRIVKAKNGSFIATNLSGNTKQFDNKNDAEAHASTKNEKITAADYEKEYEKRYYTPATGTRGEKKQKVDAAKRLARRGRQSLLHDPYTIGAGPKGKLPEGVEVEQIEEKELTKPEMKKREEIVMALKRKMGSKTQAQKSKIYAIATAQAKKSA